MTKTKSAFVYCWSDKQKEKLYVGSHVGTPSDGYICSSRHLLKEYAARPNDFTRSIVATGNIGDIRRLEASILKSIDAANNPDFYNMHNSDGKFFSTQESRAKSVSTRKKRHPLWHSAETLAKISSANLGKQHSEASRAKMSRAKLEYHPHKGVAGPTRGRKWFFDPINNENRLMVDGSQPDHFIRGQRRHATTKNA